MNIGAIIAATVLVAAVGLFIGVFLGVAGKKFAVEVDEKEVAVREALPGNNCGGCGYPGCDGLAAAIAKGEAPVNGCPVGGEPVGKVIAAIMGQEVVETARQVAYVKCAGTCEKTKDNYEYTGVEDCEMMAFIPGGGAKACAFGCLGFGSCVKACPFGAVTDQLVLMGDHQHSDAHLADTLQQLHHLKAQLGVDVAGGLVRNHQLGGVGQGAGHSHTLLLTAGEQVGVDLCLVLQVDKLQHVIHALLDLLVPDGGNMHGKGNILVHSHGGDQPEILKDDAHLTAQVGDLAAAQAGNILPVHQHAALGGGLLAQDQLEQGGFARARVTQQKNKLAVIHMEVDILQGRLCIVLVLL